jgi:hypothetical protein
LIDVWVDQDQLHEREQYILELEMKLNDKDRELNALKIGHQTVGGLHLFYTLHSMIISDKIFIYFVRCGQIKIFLESKPKSWQLSGTDNNF